MYMHINILMAEAKNQNYYNSLSFYRTLPPDHMTEYKGRRMKVTDVVSFIVDEGKRAEKLKIVKDKPVTK